MAQGLNRRDAITRVSTVTLATLLTGPTSAARAGEPTTDILRTDNAAKIIETAKSILEEDYIATLITIDEHGMPRARSVGVWMPDNNFVLWIGTRRTSRKVRQIVKNPKAALHFARDDIEGQHAKAYYASFMGIASVHTDEATIMKRAPAEEYRRAQWPNFPGDYAAIRFETQWVEIMGRGIKSDDANWQPQGLSVRSSP